ncbi:serine/threonine protein kinase [Streptomyces sp. NPDC002888]|uniref:serine/threonine protein kinase n=1 Tax=Streptomyces sp. NPDC002888 TaxID=3364668 RepID=UPI0036ABD894
MTMVKAHVSTHELVAGRYRLLDVVHRETNRVCWYGEDVETSRPCLLTGIGLPPDAGEETTGRVLRMSETMARLCPGQVAPVVGALTESGTLWTVTDCVDGTPLGEVLAQQSTLGHVRAARIGLELLDVLDTAHGQGITHGELSPGQVFVRDRGPIVVTGFGLAGATLAPRLTAPSYASPEQASDQRIGPAADLWALGAMLYTMVEGRPPFRDRGRPEATLKGVDRLPLRTPVHAGPLNQVVQGLLRKDSRERLTRPVIRAALTRVLTEEPDGMFEEESEPLLRRAYTAVVHAGPGWSGRTMVAGTALAVVTVAVAVLAATDQLTGADNSSSDAQARPSASADASLTPSPPSTSGSASAQSPDGQATRPSDTPTATASKSPSASASFSAPESAPASSAGGLPPGFHRYDAAEGFSVALPDGWKRLQTQRQGDLAYRVTYGASGDPRTLAVTYSQRVGPDPVVVWRDDVEPGLKREDGFRRIGDIEATTYQGYKAADMEWLTDYDGTRIRTFGRGFLLGGHRGFSLRWTAPAADWDASPNQRALDTALDTFRPASD